MTLWGRHVRRLALLLSSAALAGCVLVAPAPQEPPKPIIEAPTAQLPSKASQNLRTSYARMETRLLSRGLLRTDGGGIDTPYDIRDITQNFERIVFFDEFTNGKGFQIANSEQSGVLTKWTTPISIALSFGGSVPQSIQDVDQKTVHNYVKRLSKLTGHDIAFTQGEGNFDVILAGLDDKSDIVNLLSKRSPLIKRETLRIIELMPSDVHCLVFSFSDPEKEHAISYAFALIRAEHTDLMRKSCYHEEIAQGLGLTNDSPRARPSIFNDDEEFATLTTHDEVLLQMLYDPRLKSGMSLERAKPIITQIAADLNRPNS